jgi:hypothetical protein
VVIGENRFPVGVRQPNTKVNAWSDFTLPTEECIALKNTVWAIDPTGKFILLEKVRTKLMSVPAPLKIALITRGKLASNYTVFADDGWSLLRFRTGNAAPETFDSIDDVLDALVQES